MKRTSKYDLAYFEQGDTTSAIYEMQRWETLDAQLYGLYSILGNGILNGWNLVVSSGLSIVVTTGKGHVNFVAVESTENTTISNLSPNTRNYIYAYINDDSYWDQSVDFIALSSLDELGNGLYLGYVDTDSIESTDVDTTGRTNLGFMTLVQTLVSEHRHIGGTTNPSQINLATDVQGIINQNNLPDLDASIIQTGVLDQDRLPVIDHITKLTNQGTLTHAQLDSFVETLSLPNHKLMGETSTINLLQLILALKHAYPDIDEYLVNEIAYIPGISPDSYVDWVNTTATVDILPYSEGGQHTITGSPTTARNAYTKTWNTEQELESGSSYHTFIDGSNVALEVTENTLTIDEFSDITKWNVETADLSSVTASFTQDNTTFVIPPNSGKLTIGDQSVEVALSLKREFDAQDWSNYNYIVFYLKTTNVQHGDIYFYLNDNTYGTQDSYTKILDRNAPTFNIDTLQNGWQEIVVDISAYNRDNINTIGFYVSTQEGWDTSKGFDFNIDNVYLTDGNKFRTDGYVRVIFGQDDFLYEFWRVRWDASIPTDSQSAGLALKCRTRVGNTLLDLSTATWSSYTSTSGTEISLPAGALYKYIEIEMYFKASTDLSRSASVKKIYLDYYVGGVENTFTYDKQDDWESGNLFNLDTTTTPDSLLIAKTNEVNDIFYGTNTYAVQLDDNLSELYRVTGYMLPKSTYQSLNDLQPSLGIITGVARGDQGNFWLTDTDNDRVLELDKSGALVRGFYGSFVTTPFDSYGIEEAGPGSNTNVASTTTTTTTASIVPVTTTIDVLHSIYNSEEGILYVVFDKDLENIYDANNNLDMDKIYLKIGTQRFYLDDSTVELLGVDETNYNLWYALYNSTNTDASFIQQFKFTSHVLQITLDNTTKILLNHMVNTEMPSIIILSPYSQEVVDDSVTVKFLTYNITLGTGSTGDFIRVTLDNSVVQDIRSNSITFTGLSDGLHTVTAQLYNASGSPKTNIEATAGGDFIVSSTTLSVPYISVLSPKANQIYSNSPILVEFETHNFAIISTDQHIRYSVDGGAAEDHYTTDPIQLDDLDAGSHTIQIYMVDKWGTSLGYTYGTVNTDFIVGLNSAARVKLYVESGAIYNVNKDITTGPNNIYVDVANVYFRNIYSPIDIQVIPADTSAINPDGLPTVLVAKLRSQSWTSGLGTSAANAEFIRRLEASATTTTTTTGTETTTTTSSSTTTTTTTSIYSAIDTAELIYGTKYLDGHSVVQLTMKGEVLLSNNAAIFADSKVEAKETLGSAEKLGDSELLMGDSRNKRAIITYTNLTTQKPYIEWEYNSDRYVSDFHIVIQDDVTITIGNDSIDNSDVFIRQGTNIIWVNSSITPVTIYSGTTTYDDFQLDPNLNLYGDEFKSTVLQPGDRYSFKFVTVGEFNWFIYPNILTGKVTVNRNRISNLDKFIILENDGLDSPFSSRVIKVNSWGNITWDFGSSYLVKPRDARPMLNNKVIIST